MKNILLLFLLVSCFSFGVYAQGHTWQYGIHGGVNINSGRGNALNNAAKGTITGFSLGAHLTYKFSDHLGIKFMPQYDRNGWVYRGLLFESGSALQKGNAYRKLDYLNLPVLAMFSCGGAKIQLNTGAGMFAGYLLKNTLTIKPGKKSGSTLQPTSSVSDAYKKFNYGLSASLGLQFALTENVKLNLDVMDNLGLANLQKGNGDARTNSLAGIVGLSFTCN